MTCFAHKVNQFIQGYSKSWRVWTLCPIRRTHASFPTSSMYVSQNSLRALVQPPSGSIIVGKTRFYSDLDVFYVYSNMYYFQSLTCITWMYFSMYNISSKLFVTAYIRVSGVYCKFHFLTQTPKKLSRGRLLSQSL